MEHLLRIPKRGEKELSKLNLYFNTKNVDNNTLRLESLSNSKVFIIILDNQYPTSRYISINDILYMGDCSITLADFVVSRFIDYSRHRILIYCHPNKDWKRHWSINLFSHIDPAIMDSNTQVDTIDVLAGGTIMCDGFSDHFIDSNLGIYNTVFIPDCGGVWFTIQSSLESHIQLITLISKVKSIVKQSNGTLWISKILHDETKLVLEHYYGNKFIKYNDPDISVITYDYLLITH